MKFLFLDVDGVLNSANDCPNWTSIEDEVCERCVLLVKSIINATLCKVVISSSWRRIPSHMFTLTKILNSYGIEIYDETPKLSYESSRCNEICTYLHDKMNCGLLDSFVILDDENIDPFLNTRQIKTTYSNGLQPKHVSDAISILHKQLDQDDIKIINKHTHKYERSDDISSALKRFTID